MWMLGTLWERCTCTNIGRLSVSHRLLVNVTDIMTNVVKTTILKGLVFRCLSRMIGSTCQPWEV